MKLTGYQARAARALVQWPRKAAVELEALAAFERENVDPGEEARERTTHDG